MDEFLAREINAVSRLGGSFVLRSGRTATHYFDKYPLRVRPGAAAAKIGVEDAGAAADPGTEVLAGLGLGSVPIAAAMSLESGLPAMFVRKAAKTYGTCRAVEGGEIAGRRTVIIEDVITTGRGDWPTPRACCARTARCCSPWSARSGAATAPLASPPCRACR